MGIMIDTKARSIIAYSGDIDKLISTYKSVYYTN
jgi:hypothetical protein